MVCSEEPSTKPTVSAEGIESKDVVKIPHQDIKQAEEGYSLIEFSEILQDPQEESCKVSIPFKDKTVLELECEIDLIEKQLQFMRDCEKLKLENLVNRSPFEFICDGDFIHSSFDIDDCIQSLAFPEFNLSFQVIQLISQSPLAEKFKVKLADAVIACVWSCLEFHFRLSQFCCLYLSVWKCHSSGNVVNYFVYVLPAWFCLVNHIYWTTDDAIVVLECLEFSLQRSSEQLSFRLESWPILDRIKNGSRKLEAVINMNSELSTS